MATGGHQSATTRSGEREGPVLVSARSVGALQILALSLCSHKFGFGPRPGRDEQHRLASGSLLRQPLVAKTFPTLPPFLIGLFPLGGTLGTLQGGRRACRFRSRPGVDPRDGSGVRLRASGTGVSADSPTRSSPRERAILGEYAQSAARWFLKHLFICKRGQRWACLLHEGVGIKPTSIRGMDMWVA